LILLEPRECFGENVVPRQRVKAEPAALTPMQRLQEQKPTLAAPHRVINLMEALRRSIAQDKKPATARKGATATPAARKRA
jgi:non-homologous end joining protein Ku